MAYCGFLLRKKNRNSEWLRLYFLLLLLIFQLCAVC